MLQTTAVKLREDFEREVARCIDNHEALKVTRDRGENLVIVGETDWRAIEETLYLNRIPGLVESIRESAQEPLPEGVRLEDMNW
ncbi:MAG: Antitoxin component YafN of the YafNO toxin-antitoxin module, PHD/YefM family [Candidatus Kentron sp. G]|nr:MAG: Antitoxin component YafN of the YafNO toxin-antitoxin module, PHD/YefM family [Candidatus Kentron sp. G]VFN03176.1 MAG: Antitoxin component YafN of the YafNO toxin-antitoxin module, PHD/YefM family [Candidatus Kentron sp. G]VFN03415.1 MAG: Antitoxin component YafN of the YafNO toxin-antitoxin module, PHD/YefM family [Candidatus Kentron sp. G]